MTPVTERPLPQLVKYTAPVTTGVKRLSGALQGKVNPLTQRGFQCYNFGGGNSSSAECSRKGYLEP